MDLERLRESAGTMSAGAGELLLNQCRKPQRVSTKWQSVHLPDPDTQRAISPCLHAQDPQSACTNQLDLTNFCIACFVHGSPACHQTDFLVDRCTLTSRILNSCIDSHPSSEAKSFTWKAQSASYCLKSRRGCSTALPQTHRTISGLHRSSCEAASRASVWRAPRAAPVSAADAELAVSSARSASPSTCSATRSSGAVSAFTAPRSDLPPTSHHRLISLKRPACLGRHTCPATSIQRHVLWTLVQGALGAHL